MEKLKEHLLEIIIIGGCLALWIGGTAFSDQSAESSVSAGPVVAAQTVSLEELKIELFATAWCGYCTKTRTFFANNNIKYVEYDVEKNRTAAARAQKLTGGGGVPVIVIGDDVVIRGYDPARIRNAIYQKTGVRI